MVEHVPFGELSWWGIGVDKKVKHKNKITSKLLQEPEDRKKKLAKFVSETKTQEGGEEGAARE